jgi:hypothetical protein
MQKLASCDCVIKEAIDAGVISADKHNGKIFRHIAGKTKELKLFTESKGYKRYTLAYKGKVHKVSAHRTIWIQEYGVPSPLLQINHIDGNPMNNSITNLELATPSENKRHGGIIKNYRGEIDSVSNEIKNKIRNEYIKGSHTFGCNALSKRYLLNRKTIWTILYGRIATKRWIGHEYVIKHGKQRNMAEFYGWKEAAND